MKDALSLKTQNNSIKQYVKTNFFYKRNPTPAPEKMGG
jgi:hypothetical protein